MGAPEWRLNRAELARTHRHIDQHSSPEGCWLWTGPTNKDGYAYWSPRPGQRPRVIHRTLWEHYNDQPFPDGMQGDHTCHGAAVAAGTCEGGNCRHHRCVNPAHIEPVTNAENTRRQDHAKRRVTHCPQGHPYDETNTYIKGDGKRRCRACLTAQRATT